MQVVCVAFLQHEVFLSSTAHNPHYCTPTYLNQCVLSEMQTLP